MTFQYHGPIQPKNPLYQQRMGMDKEGQVIEDLSAHIEGACFSAANEGTQNYFVINGSRQSGKTSLLLEISQRIKATGGYACWIDFQRMYDATPEASINFMAREILKTIPKLSDSVNVPDKFEYDGFEIDEWLWKLPIPKKKPVVLLLEELGALPLDSRRRLGGLLRGAFGGRHNTPWNQVVLVFFGGIEMHDMITFEVSPLFNICENISLLDLNLNATQSLLASGFSQAGDFDTAQLNDLSQSIYAQVSGHPYLTQYLGEQALNYTKKNGVLPSNIQPVLSHLHVESSEYFEYLYQSIQKYDLLEFTKNLLQNRTGNHPDKNTLRRMELLGVIIKNADTRFSIRNRLIQISLEKILLTDREQETEITSINDLGPEEETVVIRENMIQDLLESLFKLTCMETAEKRRSLLVRSGIEGLQPGLDVEGSAKEVVARLFYILDKLPRLNNGCHPLGLFLTDVKTSLGRGEEGIIILIDKFINKYGLMKSKEEIKGISKPEMGAPPIDKYERAVFVSYAWEKESEHIVNKLEQAFAKQGMYIVRDKKDLGYRGSIKEFEQRIGRGQCIILVISDKYLRSEHCMLELVEIAENHEFRKRIFPIVMKDTRIYKTAERLDYIQHWENEITQLSDAIKKVKLLYNLGRIMDELDKYARIRARFDDLTDLLSDMNALTPEMHAASDFDALISACAGYLGHPPR